MELYSSSPAQDHTPTATVSVDDETIAQALSSIAPQLRSLRRPTRLMLKGVAQRVFEKLATYRSDRALLQFAYSVKTNPHPSLLAQALRTRCYAEVINPAELDHAVKVGFASSRLVYNGPYPAHYTRTTPAYVFADSLESYRQATGRFDKTVVIGMRIRPPGIQSHFGVPEERLNEVIEAVHGASRPHFGVAFHVRPQDYGDRTFRSIVRSVIDVAVQLRRRTGTAVMVFDVGGGKRPEEFDRAVTSGEFEWLEDEVKTALSEVRAIIAEPGQALATPTEVLVGTILEIRSSGARVRELVTDIGYPDVPQIGSFEHRFFVIDGGKVGRLSRGRGRIIGRTCLEYDILADELDLDACRIGMKIVVADCGAYDASMAFNFGCGSR